MKMGHIYIALHRNIYIAQSHGSDRLCIT